MLTLKIEADIAEQLPLMCLNLGLDGSVSGFDKLVSIFEPFKLT